MTVRLYAPVGAGAAPGAELDLPAEAARHAQVRRVQPGDPLVLFDGAGTEWPVTVAAMGRRDVRVVLGAPRPGLAPPQLAVTLALGMPANERMDALVEKATELGVAAIVPLVTARSVLRLAGERAARRIEHWRAVAIAACEQSGRAALPAIAPVAEFDAWLAGTAGAVRANGAASRRVLLSTRADARPIAHVLPAAGAPGPAAITLLSGPEGGLAPHEEDAARAAGFVPVSLGAAVLRADTAPLAALAWLVIGAGSGNGGNSGDGG